MEGVYEFVYEEVGFEVGRREWGGLRVGVSEEGG